MENNQPDNEAGVQPEKAKQDEAFFELEKVLQEISDADAQIILLLGKALVRENAQLHNPIIEKVCAILDKLNRTPSVTLLLEARQLFEESGRSQGG